MTEVICGVDNMFSCIVDISHHSNLYMYTLNQTNSRNNMVIKSEKKAK